MLLVTGGAGFIGSNLVAALAERGLGPIAICDHFGAGEEGAAKWRNLAKHPIVAVVPPEQLMDWLAEEGQAVSTIFHMGASSSTVESDVDFILRNNFTLSMKLWYWCAENDVRLIYASSAATYGDGQLGFDDDNDPVALGALRPLNPYGWSKQLFDTNALRLAREGATPPQWAGLKFFNVYGPNEYHKGGQRSVAHQLFEQIRDAGRVRLFKSHHPDYEDGGQMRDFVWVGDCVDAMLFLYENSTIDGIFNAGSGIARSFKDLALATFAAMEREPDIHYIDTPESIRQHYQYYTQAEMERLREAGFDRPATVLEDGVAAYVRGYLMTDDPYR
ncbi:ADP-glyceromanno-heptose 6-epimerase [Marivibrio halodurans]|uniref:ADP-L-glycero-D-manno-heptose-6-epimerase n=1 Tax=Marivibrio halodurans TaxID=2039722 RepID=A0A8J7S293_9PROT|nr:ADP-glyceromanno-heptose 6-epimerase [Marivibrio halodurans]MBP5858520.1 ADP-glyceromanno-heptose 6-epimerase [Marivibrio halodurans]